MLKLLFILSCVWLMFVIAFIIFVIALIVHPKQNITVKITTPFIVIDILALAYFIWYSLN
jgi:hypothetical protein